MKISLTFPGRLHPVLLETEDTNPPETPQHAQAGLRGRAERAFHAVRDRWRNADSGAAGRVRRVWSWLQSRMYADETLLAGLRHATRLELEYPPEMTPEAAQAHWRDYLARRQWRHLPWLLFYLLLSPLTLLLAPVPGPNLVGYWFVYRAIHHLLVLVGLRRVRRAQFETTYRPAPADGAGSPCDCSATTSTRGSAGATGSIASNASST